MFTKLKVGLICGGRSSEHEVSLLSAHSIYQALDKQKYDVYLIGIDKQGQWYLGDQSQLILNASDPKSIKLNQTTTSIEPRVENNSAALVNISNQQHITSIDVFFPIIHGTYGEDGSLQGLFELLNVAYVGAGVLGSAVGMDKDVMKRLLREANIPIGKFFTFTKHTGIAESLTAAAEQLRYPLFVKPANGGSSVGVTKVHNQSELHAAVEEALKFDTKVILEQAINGREIECSVLGNEDPISSVPGEIIPTHEFYDYQAKYVDEHGAALKIPADLDTQLASHIQQLAIQTFKTLECSGMARIDFFLTKENQVFVNEINTLPGFTSISMYPKLWEATGIPYAELLDKLIQCAMELKQAKDKLIRSYKPEN